MITKDETTIIEGTGSIDDVAGRVSKIKLEIENTDSDWDREKLQERLAKLAGGVSIAALVLTAEAVVADEPEPAGAAAPMCGGGGRMPGMGMM